MRPLSNILTKEVRELLTPATVVPIIVMALLFGSLGGLMGDVEEEVSKPPVIGLIDQDGEGFSLLAAQVLESNAEVVYNGTSVEEGISAVTAAGGTALLVLPEDFTQNITSNHSATIKVYWIMSGTGMLDTLSSTSLDGLLGATNKALSMVILESGLDIDANTTLTPTKKVETTTFKGNTLENVSPSLISSTLSSQNLVVPLIVLMVIIMSGSTVISSMGLEKENKTLETLLTMPVKRSYIVLGKLGGAAVVGLLMAFIYMLGMNSYMEGMSGSAALDLAEHGIALGMTDYLLVGLSLFLAVVGGLAMCLVIGTFARDYKSAQALTMPITFLAMVPMFAMMMKDFSTLPGAVQAAIFAIPFSHPMMAINNLLFGDYTLVLAGIAYEAVFAAAMMAIAVYLFRKDILVTGRMKKNRAAGSRKGLRR